MGFFVHLSGRFRCVRCKKRSDSWFQTRVLRTDSGNSGRFYSVGDSEILDGLDDYHPLHPWNGLTPLVVAVGDWDCKHCGLNWQWAKAVFAVQATEPVMTAGLIELSTLQPLRADQLDGIHYLEPELAELSGLWGQGRLFDGPAGLARWTACSLEERRDRVALGYRTWCLEVAGVDTSRETSGPR